MGGIIGICDGQFLWYSWVALPHEFISSTNFFLERLFFFTEVKTDVPTELNPHE